MISASDLLQVISEIHQYSMILIELKDAVTIGISHSPNGKLSYFQLEGSLGPQERSQLVRMVSEGQMLQSVGPLSLEQMLQRLDGKRTKHIWLETMGRERRELGFVSVSELKAFFQGHPHR